MRTVLHNCAFGLVVVFFGSLSVLEVFLEYGNTVHKDRCLGCWKADVGLVR